ncbi:MAG: phosphatase domain-containing protein [Chitinophagaceae bacterium]
MENTQDTLINVIKISTWEKLNKRFFNKLRLTRDPIVKVYHGYGHSDRLVIYGHVLALSPLPGKRYSNNFLINAFDLLRLFMVRPFPRATVNLNWDGKTYSAESEEDGFFKIEWQPDQPLSPGWHPVQVNLVKSLKGNESILSVGHGNVFIPYVNQYICISDIDDTFLISHSSNLRKRLKLLLTKNAHSRQPFEGVINHYQLMATAGTNPQAPNPFFYVSSSEWNLYEYIVNFSHKHSLPKGVYLLSQLKQISQVFKTGQSKHATKFIRIARIVESYPQQKYILFGDDSQEDPVIYASIAKHFPGNVRCVYIRHVHKTNQEKVKNTIKEIEDAGVSCCYFTHSKDAILHSRQIGLIQ